MRAALGLLVVVLTVAIVFVSEAADKLRTTITLSDNDAGTVSIGKNRDYSIQCDGEVHVKTCLGDPCAAGTTDPKLQPTAFIAPVDVEVANDTKLSIKRSTAADTDGGTITCRVNDVIHNPHKVQ